MENDELIHQEGVLRKSKEHYLLEVRPWYMVNILELPGSCDHLIDRQVEVFCSNDTNWSKEIKVKVIDSVEYKSIPLELECGDGVECRTRLNKDGSKDWFLIGYTEGGYAQSPFPVKELVEFLRFNGFINE